MKKGGDPNLQFSIPLTGGKTYQTLLHFAVSCDNIDACRLLVENGANPNLMDYDGWAPIKHAINCGKGLHASEKIFTYLLPMTDLSLVDRDGRTLLHYIAAFGSEEQYDEVASRVPWLASAKDCVGRTPADILKRRK